MDPIGFEAARKLGESAVALKAGQERNDKLALAVASLKTEIESARTETIRLSKKEDIHNQNSLKLLHGIRDLHTRIAQQTEEVRLLEEDKLGVAVRRNAAHQRLASTREALARVSSEVKDAERQREEALLVAERARVQRRTAETEKRETLREKKAADKTLQRLRVSTDKCAAQTNFVQALLT